ncbi:hypothetical protein SAMN05421640_3330 [Ekhidna lutea]|uniref:Uncharacterized protein n=1 Tax=Ekhidna lutea TaxID=447679 RepID=A0A239LLN7_EKHLU|nr:hypothetical protein [Ekhidna lutea]SNT30798.1 hypothetical protein SAMN05421640_3330 [Ekhidna lutea]
MEKTQIEIVPGIGLGALKFGMNREEVKSILGEPDHQEITHYGEDDSDQSDAWEYHPLRLDLSFEEAEDWRLTILSVSSDDYLLKGSSLIGLNQEELMEELELLGVKELEMEDLSSEDHPEQLLIAAEELGVNFWLHKGILEEIQWGPLFQDEHTIKWPE